MVRKKNKPAKLGRINFKKRVFFTFFTILIPIIFFVILELILRFFNFGSQFDLLMVSQNNGKKEYSLNRNVGSRYFSKYTTLVPKLMPESFTYQKGANTFRIFCLGGSTMASFPFEQNARLHFQIQQKLSGLYPDIDFEVVNLAMSAVNSYTVLDFVRELVKYEPDLFLIYMGHNEFYGAMGVGSVQSIGKNRQFIQIYLKLMHFKVVQLLSITIDYLRGIFQKPYPSTHPNQNLMQMIVQKQVIALNSKDFDIAAQNFEKNLIDIIKISKEHHIKVLISTLVSNLNTIAPFQSSFSPDFSKQEQSEWDSEFSQGKRAIQEKDFFTALTHFLESEKMDKKPAILSYNLAKSYEGLGQYDKALEKYKQARDLDGLRFRAPGIFNDIIYQTCSDLKVPYVDMEKTFAENASFGIMGDQFFYEHVHPNIFGYKLMADNFCQSLITNNMIDLAGVNNFRPSKDLPVNHLNFSYVTDFDLEIGNEKISRLIKRWPFRPDQFDHEFTYAESDSIIKSFVFPYLTRQISWEDARYRLAEFYENNGNYEKAEKEYDILSLILPNNYYPHLKKANVYFLMKQFVRAEQSLFEALERNNQSAAVFSKLGLIKFMQKQYNDAQDKFKKALEINKNSNELSNSGIAMANYYLALTCIKLGNKESALLALKETLRFQPNNQEAQNILILITSNKELKLIF